MKTIVTICFLLLGVMAAKAQEALRIYTAEVSRIETLTDETKKSSDRGKALAAFFDSRAAEAGKQVAVAEAAPLLRELVDYDFRGAFAFFVNLKNKDDAVAIMQTHTSQEERILLRTMTRHIIANANKMDPQPYPANIPQPGYGLKGKWNAIAQADNGEEEASKGFSAEMTKDYDEALKWYKLSAEKGNAEGMYGLGMAYLNGQGVAQDEKEAIVWLKKSAEKRHGWAMVKLRSLGHDPVKPIAQADNGNIELLNGYDAYNAKNYTEAMNWYRKSANKGNAGAMYGIALMYYYNQGVDQNYTEAFNWLKKSVDNGIQNNEGEYLLGVMYYNGQGVAQNKPEAMRLFQKSADKGFAEAKQTLKNIEAKRDKEIIAQNDNGNAEFTKGNDAFDASNYTEALSWFKKSADKGNTYSMYNIGVMYEHGDGVKQSGIEAMRWYELSAVKGNETAKETLQKLDKTGRSDLFKGTAAYDAKNYAEALKWYKKSVDKGNMGAGIMLSALEKEMEMLKIGIGNSGNATSKSLQEAANALTEAEKMIAQKNHTAAILLLEKEADNKNAEAMYLLAKNYYNDVFVKNGFMEAYFWSYLGTQLRNEKCILLNRKISEEKKLELYFAFNKNNLGEMAAKIAHEYKITKDEQTALRWYKRSAGYNNAQGAIGAGFILYGKKDWEAAKQYFEKATQLGDPTGDIMLKEIEKEMEQ